MIWDSQVMSRNRRLIGRTKGRGCLAWVRMLGLASAPGSVRVPVDYEATPGDNLKFEEKKEGKSGRPGRSGEMFEKARLDPTVRTKAYRDLRSKSQFSQASGNNGESAIGQ